MFIVITGLDGSGTSTVASELNKLDKNSVLLKTPSEEFSAREEIDNTVRKTSQMAHYLYYLSSVVYMSDKIKQLYDYKNNNVYCVRYLIDTVVSHRVSGIDAELDQSAFNILEPDLTIFISTDEEIREQRISRRGKSSLDKVLDDADIRNSFVENFDCLLDKNKTVFFDNSSQDIYAGVKELYKKIKEKNIKNEI